MEDRRYLEIPGVGTHELPPLLVRGVPEGTEPREEMVERAATIVETEDMIAEAGPSANLDQRKIDLALHLTDQYFGLLSHWQWGDSILEWIRQCEITFETREGLRHLLHHDVWPHAGRSSFVDLLVEKSVPTHGVGLEKAVGMRLTFRQPPPIDCFSNQFLFYLNSPIAGAAYQTWARMSVEAPAHLPPQRFHFEVLEM
ncbi:MAG: hypothetical protein M3Y07_09250 [Acidobacteriota bacterium]|nr:hypothetical protein [Acidobacteriota bacterium]